MNYTHCNSILICETRKGILGGKGEIISEVEREEREIELETRN